MTTPTYIPTPETDALASRIVPLSRSQRMRAYRKLCLSLETRFTDTFAKNERLVMALKYYAAAPWASESGVWHDKNYAEIACAALSSESLTLELKEASRWKRELAEKDREIERLRKDEERLDHMQETGETFLYNIPKDQWHTEDNLIWEDSLRSAIDVAIRATGKGES